MIKIATVLHYGEVKQKAEAILGRDNFLRLYQDVKAKTTAAAASAAEVVRWINGQPVGKRLSQGVVDPKNPDMCSHPHNEMKKRGNKVAKWWTCNLCHSRWDRPEAPAGSFTAAEMCVKGWTAQHKPTPAAIPMNSKDPMDHTVITFGMYVGDTYQEVWNKNRGYLDWLETTYRMPSGPKECHACPQFEELALWTQAKTIQMEIWYEERQKKLKEDRKEKEKHPTMDRSDLRTSGPSPFGPPVSFAEDLKHKQEKATATPVVTRTAIHSDTDTASSDDWNMESAPTPVPTNL